MTKRGTNGSPPSRPELEQLMSADMRAVTAQSDRIGRHFARQNDVSGNDFHALLHVMVAETAGAPITSGELRQRTGLSGAAITYLVDRLIERMMEEGYLHSQQPPQITPPIAARTRDSTSVPTNVEKPPNPMARRVAISVARAATEEYMVLSAPASEPNAIAIASGQPSFWIRSDVFDACWAK